MKRLILSLLGGFAIPFLYTVIVAPLSSYIENERFKLLIGVPIRWPVIIYPNLTQLPLPMLMAVIIVCNVLVYGVLSYFVLWKRSARRNAEIQPPEPPSFVQR